MITPEELEAIRERYAECALPRRGDTGMLLRELDRLHSWAGLMELLDEHWPEWLFPMPTLPEVYGELYRRQPDGSYTRANPGARIVGLMRWLDRYREGSDGEYSPPEEGVDGYCVCQSLAEPARDCGVPAHREAARKGAQ